MGELANVAAILLAILQAWTAWHVTEGKKKKKKSMTYDVYFFEIGLKACYG